MGLETGWMMKNISSFCSFYLVHFLVYYRTMIKLNIHEAKTHLSRYLAELKMGEKIILCNRNVPVAEICPLPQPSTRRRPLGLAKGTIKISKDFFKPLPKSIEDLFYGK